MGKPSKLGSSSKSPTLRSVQEYHPKVNLHRKNPLLGIPLLIFKCILTKKKKTLAISRRMATDKGGQQGPRSTRDPPTNTTPVSRYRQPEVRNDRDQSSIGVSPAVPGFGFQFPGMPNGLTLFPPGFVLPGTTPAQPPPPGAT